MRNRKRTRTSAPRDNFVAVISLGCPKNQVDTESLLGELLTRDVVLCVDPADASIIIVNTCGFIAPARAEGAEVLCECRDLRRRGRCRLLVVVGCWVEREGTELARRYPEVDLWTGLLSPERVRWLCDVVTGGREPAPDNPREVLRSEAGRIRISPAHWAYLKIADGCDNRCAYCTIPDIRGRLRSKPHADVIDEAKVLASEGVKEIVLVAQDTTAYGRDVDGTSKLVSLLRELVKIDGIEWVRLMYAHPAHFTDALVDVIASEPKICDYLDLPLQHISDRVLAAMGRKVTRAETEALIAKLRKSCPDIMLRTTMLAGFPGETEADFAELLAFIEDARFERLGCFAYCPEPGTRAAGLPGQLPEAERQARADEVMRLQQVIAFEVAKGRIGTDVAVIIDAEGEEDGAFVGRTYGDAPEIDPIIMLTGDCAVGDITTARVTAADGYDLVGTI